MSAATRAVVSRLRAGAVVAGAVALVLAGLAAPCSAGAPALAAAGAAALPLERWSGLRTQDGGFGARSDRGDGGSDAGALRLLREASAAAVSTTYAGVQYICAWAGSGSTSVVVQIRHTAWKGAVVAVQPSVTGGGGVQVTESDNLADQVAASGVSPLADDALRLLRRNYALSLAEPETVAGRVTSVVQARRPDGTLAAGMWLDDATGLMLRREVYDRAGRLMRASAFVELTTGSTPPPMSGDEAGTRSEQVLGMPWLPLKPGRVAALRAGGWALPKALPGDLTRYEARSRSTDGQDVLHLSYSDGLSTVSLFEQRGTLDDRDMSTWRRTRMSGAWVFVRDSIPQRVVWASGGTVYTLLADAPADTVRSVVRSLPHRQHETGPVARVGRGLARVGSWLNPFS